MLTVKCKQLNEDLDKLVRLSDSPVRLFSDAGTKENNKNNS